eukprot:1146490-Pelagomonas_calceolata.AAC.15
MHTCSGQWSQAIGASVNESKTRISELKALIEQRRIQRAVAAGDLSGGGGAAEDAGDDPEEARCRAHIERVSTWVIWAEVNG